MKRLIVPAVWLCAVLGVCGPQASAASPPRKEIKDEQTSEQSLLQRIKQLDNVAAEGLAKKVSPRKQQAASQALMLLTEELLERYPNTSSKEYAQITRLRAVAHLARGNPEALAKLLIITDEIAESTPSKTLQEENAYYAIQAFVIGARFEHMPSEQRLNGTLERYQAFVEDYPDSPRDPVIRASMIRNLVALERVDEAAAQFAILQRLHPHAPATRRAAGEVNRVSGVGRPFGKILRLSDGKTIRPSDFTGRVFVIHVWSDRSKRAIDQAVELMELYGHYKSRGLQIVSVNADSGREHVRETVEALKIPWPQYHEPKGIDSDIVIDNGVIAWPTFFIIDRKGILRAVDNGDRLPELLAELFPDSPQETGLSPSKSP